MSSLYVRSTPVGRCIPSLASCSQPYLDTSRRQQQLNSQSILGVPDRKRQKGHLQIHSSSKFQNRGTNHLPNSATKSNRTTTLPQSQIVEYHTYFLSLVSIYPQQMYLPVRACDICRLSARAQQSAIHCDSSVAVHRAYLGMSDTCSMRAVL